MHLGGGHVYRCLTLANALEMAGWRVTFLSVCGTAVLVPALAQSKHAIVELAVDDVTGLSALANLGSVDAIVVDHYGLDAVFEEACRAYADLVMVIDDKPRRRHACDILLDQNLGRLAEDYDGMWDSPPRRMLLGPHYALLRPQFQSVRAEALRRPRGKVDRVFISFGAFDPNGLSWLAARAAVRAGVPRIDVALGAASTAVDPLRDWALRHEGVTVHVGKDVATLMGLADLAVGAAGSMSWERCCCGLPTLMTVIADNQSDIARAVVAVGAGQLLSMEDVANEIALVKAIRAYMDNPERVVRQSHAAAAVCDGAGIARVVQMVDQMTVSGIEP